MEGQLDVTYPLAARTAIDSYKKTLVDTSAKYSQQIDALREKLEQADTDEEKKALLLEISRLGKAFQEEMAPLQVHLPADEKAVADYEKRLGDFMLAYRRALLQTKRPVLALAYNATLFSALNGDEQDADSDGLNDNEHRTNKQTTSLSADWRLSGLWQVSGLLSANSERPAAEQGSKMGRYWGAGITFGRMIPLLKDSELGLLKEFRESLFVPGVALGLALEGQRCASRDENCKDGVTDRWVLTPLLDVKIKKEAQFRIGLSVTRNRLIDGKQIDDLSVISLYSIQLGLPK